MQANQTSACFVNVLTSFKINEIFIKLEDPDKLK